MYNRSIRFKTLITNTPERVGPATYFISDLFDKSILGNKAPFNSTQVRKSAFENKNLVDNPSPNKYKICFRKIRIVGGTSMRNKSPRLKYKISRSIRGLYPPVNVKRLPGKLHLGIPPHSKANCVSTIPEKGTRGYKITSSGVVKIHQPPENRPIGPATYYNPEGNHNYTTLKYKGSFWSERTADRFYYKEEESPGPADYSVGQTSVSPWKKYQDHLQSMKKLQAPLLRCNDMLQQKLCRENLPGPGTYSSFDPNMKKSEFGKLGTFAISQNLDLYKVSEGPGPAAYTNPRTAMEKVSTITSVKQSAFNVNAERFSSSNKTISPGPNHYNPQTGMWNDVQKKTHSKYSKWNAPFDSSAPRKISTAKPDSCYIPSPDWYYPQVQSKGSQKTSHMFASTTIRDPLASTQISPGSAVYSTEESFKIISCANSHLQNKSSAFLSSSSRLEPLRKSSSPGPNTYKLPESTLSTKGRSISLNHDSKLRYVTPGPADYKVHAKYIKPSVYTTYNVTLQAQTKEVSRLEKRSKTKINPQCFAC